MKYKKRISARVINIDKVLNLKKEKKKRTRHKSIVKIVPKSNPKNHEKVPIGIPNLDKLIDGGFEKNSANVIVGGSGSGKTIFATQFLIEGMRRGEKCLYVTFEEKKEQFYKHMIDFGWNLADYEQKKLLTFLEYSPGKVKTMLEEGGGTIESAIVKQGITRIVIDSITSFALLFEKELERREAAVRLFGMISGWNCTSLLTLEEDPLTERELTAKPIEFESDSIILIYYVQEKGERKRYLEIIKMRGVKHSKRIHMFEVGSHGITVSPRKISNIKGR